jgi:hypothetical protein
MANVIKILLPLHVYADKNIFPKTIRFFTISFNQANGVYVKIFATAQLTMFFNKKISVLFTAFSAISLAGQ